MLQKELHLVVGVSLFLAACPAGQMGSGATMGPEPVVTAMPAVKVELPPPPNFANLDIPLQNPDGTWTLHGLRKKKAEQISKEVKVKGFLLEVYQCPPCPKKQTCKMCDQPHFFIGDKPDTKKEKALMVVDYLLPKQKPPALTIGKQYDVSGTFSINSPTGFGSSDGLLIFGHMVDDKGAEFMSQAQILEKKAMEGAAKEAEMLKKKAK